MAERLRLRMRELERREAEGRSQRDALERACGGPAPFRVGSASTRQRAEIQHHELDVLDPSDEATVRDVRRH